MKNSGAILSMLSLIILAAGGCSEEKGPMSGSAQSSGKAHSIGQSSDGDAATATFAAGCFWGVEAAFRQMEGVLSTAVGYSGGTTENPTYKKVCTDRTGHAECVQVRYDSAKVSYDRLLEAFWACHDPTQVNRQGPDVGTQYRSAIFYHTPEQETAARASMKKLQDSGKLKGKIATEIVPAQTFWRAEEYHQQYLEKRGAAACPSKTP